MVADLLDAYLAVQLVGLVAVVVLAVWGKLFWDRRYRGAADSADRFAPTHEIFRDPASGRMVRVFYNARTGERQYRDVPEG